MMMHFFQSSSMISDSWKQMEQQAGSIRRTEIAAVPPETYQGGNINLTVRNDGQTNLADFPYWDVIAQRQGMAAYYIDYTENASPGNNKWTVQGIYLSDNTTEVFDPNILNPGEKMIVVVNLNPEIVQETTGRVAISTPNGVTSQCLVTRGEE
jgi:hypothetical protein